MTELCLRNSPTPQTIQKQGDQTLRDYLLFESLITLNVEFSSYF